MSREDHPELLEIETARLRLRPFILDDLDAIHRIWVDPAVRKHLWDDVQISREKAESVLVSSLESFENHGFGLLAVIHKERGGLIGFCGFRFLDDTPEVELLYGIAAPYWGMGLATEAAKAAIRYGFEYAGFDRIVAITNTENAVSWRVMEKAGMSYEKRAPHHDQDSMHYAISRETFRPDDPLYVLRRAR